MAKQIMLDRMRVLHCRVHAQKLSTSDYHKVDSNRIVTRLSNHPIEFITLKQ